MKRFKTVDDYIANVGQWQVEVQQLRKILQSTGLTEAVKWGIPCYTCDGKNVVGICSFKAYFGLWFYQGVLLRDKSKVLINAQEGTTKALRQWRMTSTRDIKSNTIKSYVKEAIQLVRAGQQVSADKNKPIVVPPELKKALQKSSKLKRSFGEMRPGRRREYADYIAQAIQAETRQRRIDKILPMIAANVGLNDKYR